jgi:hypothetical protein
MPSYTRLYVGQVGLGGAERQHSVIYCNIGYRLTGRSEGIHEIPVDILCKTLKRHRTTGRIAECFAHHYVGDEKVPPGYLLSAASGYVIQLFDALHILRARDRMSF